MGPRARFVALWVGPAPSAGRVSAIGMVECSRRRWWCGRECVCRMAVVVVHCFGVVTSLDKTRRTQITRRWCGDATVRCDGANDVAITSQTQKATPKLCKYAHVTHGEHRTQRLGGGDPHPTNEGRQTSRSTCASTRSTSAWCCTRSTSACTRSTGACGLVGTPNKQPADRRVRSCELVRASP